MSAADDRSPRAGTLDRGLSILEYFVKVREAPASGVVDALGLSRSAIYRILDTLRERGYVEINPASGKLRLGAGAAELGMAALAGIEVVRLAPPYLHRLVEATFETAFLAVMNGNAMVYVYKEEAPQAVKMSSELGSRRPLHCTSLGKAYLSALPDETRRSLIGELDLKRYTANTITDAAALEAEIASTQERGYAVDRIEVEKGVACVGAPVRDHTGLPVAAISVAGPEERVLRLKNRIGPLVAETASAISRRLGYVVTLTERE